VSVFRRRARVELQEVDAAGVVFYAWFFFYAHRAYEAALLAHGFDLAELLRAGTHALPMVHAEADYKRPLRYGDEVAVDLACDLVSERSCRFHSRVWQLGAGETLCAEVVQVHACLDIALGRSTALPPALRTAVERLAP
jgi:1,4-dihydroxy-2-naphthoyl-CoA hydrolase